MICNWLSISFILLKIKIHCVSLVFKIALVFSKYWWILNRCICIAILFNFKRSANLVIVFCRLIYDSISLTDEVLLSFIGYKRGYHFFLFIVYYILIVVIIVNKTLISAGAFHIKRIYLKKFFVVWMSWSDPPNRWIFYKVCLGWKLSYSLIFNF